MDSHPLHALLLENLSDRLLRYGEAEVWRKLFLGNAVPQVRFEQRKLTLLWIDMPSDWTTGELVVLAARFGGRSDRYRNGAVLFSFDQPAQALSAALTLQKLGGKSRPRSGLRTEPCALARFTIDGQERCIVLPPDLEELQAWALGAAPGTIAIAPQTYEALQHHISDEVHDGLLATELDEERVTGASITMAPAWGADASTFAGLGLS